MPQNKERDPYYDNLKGILICLVCIGHCLNIYRGDNAVCNYLFNLIYAFHMPLFFFISGYFSKNVDKSYKRAFNSLILPAIPFELLYYIMHVVTKAENTQPFLTPIFAYWFVFALFACKILLVYFSRTRWIVPLAFIIALVAGFNPNINEYMTLSRFLCMFPFFMLGYFTTPEYMKRIRDIKAFIPMLSGLVSAVAVFMLIKYADSIGADTGFTLRAPYEDYRGMVFRATQFVLAVLMSLLIMKITPKVSTYFQTLGQRTLQIYFLHFYFVTLIKMAGLASGNPIADALIMIAAGVAMAMLLSTKPISVCYNKMLQFIEKLIPIEV